MSKDNISWRQPTWLLELLSCTLIPEIYYVFLPYGVLHSYWLWHEIRLHLIYGSIIRDYSKWLTQQFGVYVASLTIATPDYLCVFARLRSEAWARLRVYSGLGFLCTCACVLRFPVKHSEAVFNCPCSDRTLRRRASYLRATRISQLRIPLS